MVPYVLMLYVIVLGVYILANFMLFIPLNIFLFQGWLKRGRGKSLFEFENTEQQPARCEKNILQIVCILFNSLTCHFQGKINMAGCFQKMYLLED